MLHLDGMTLNGNTPFTLQFHIVQDLILEIPLIQGTCGHQQTIGQGTLAVIDVRYDAEISYVIHWVHPHFSECKDSKLPDKKFPCQPGKQKVLAKKVMNY
jgi:hypothetical protein